MEEKKPNGESNELLNPDDFDENKTNGAEENDNSSTEGDENSKSTSSDGKSAEELEKEKEAKKNAQFAEMRRQKEAKEKAEKEEAERIAREQKIRDEATLKAELGILKKNPYTEEPIVDEDDLFIYKLQKELDDEGKDPVTDLPKKIAEYNRNAKKVAEQKANAEAKAKSDIDQKIANEVNELRNKYPDVNTAELAKDPLFREILDGKVGRWSQLEIYEYYLVKKAEAEKNKADKDNKTIIEENGKKITKTPSSSASGRHTPKSVESMTEEEFREYYNNKYGG